MVETLSQSNLKKSGDTPEHLRKIELHEFYLYHEYEGPQNFEDLDEEKIEENADIVEGELASMESILTEREFQKIEDIDSKLD